MPELEPRQCARHPEYITQDTDLQVLKALGVPLEAQSQRLKVRPKVHDEHPRPCQRLHPRSEQDMQSRAHNADLQALSISITENRHHSDVGSVT
eukprot:4754573-Pyramimonas_sp.AAC.1